MQKEKITAKNYKEKGFVKARYMGVKIYYNRITDEIIGRTWFADINVGVALWFDINILCCDSFAIYEEIEKQ